QSQYQKVCHNQKNAARNHHHSIPHFSCQQLGTVPTSLHINDFVCIPIRTNHRLCNPCMDKNRL
ncbi:MAG: hypothetical protein ACLUDG_06775, partial [Butyricicoccus sp.]